MSKAHFGYNFVLNLVKKEDFGYRNISTVKVSDAKQWILKEKDILNPNEAIELFVLSRRKFYKLLKENRKLGFLAMYGSRKLIIRSEFQKYLDKHPELKRRGS